MNSAKLTLTRIYGAPGLGGYRFGFSFTIAMPADAPEYTAPRSEAKKQRRRRRIWDFTGSVTVGRPGSPGIGLGRIFPEHAFWFESGSYANEQHLGMLAELTPHQVEVLEELRMGGPLHFSISYSVLSANWLVDEGGTALAPGTEYQSVQRECDMLSHQATQSDWLRVLEEMGYGRFLLFEIPMPGAGERGAETPSTAHLIEAQRHLFQGQYDDVIVDCRRALERFWVEEKLTKEASSIHRKRESGSDRLPKRGRFLLMHNALKYLTDLAAHGDAGVIEPFSRTEAVCVLSMVAALLGLSPVPAAPLVCPPSSSEAL